MCVENPEVGNARRAGLCVRRAGAPVILRPEGGAPAPPPAPAPPSARAKPAALGRRRSLWSAGRCVVIGGATAGGGGAGPGGAFGFGLVLTGSSVDGGNGSPQVLPMDLGAVSLPQRSGERASGA